MSHRHAIGLVILLASGTPGVAQERPAVDFDRPDAFVAATGAFSFFSDPRIGLHDFLVWRLASEEPVQHAPECLAALPTTEREAFEDALAHYRETLAGDDRDDLLLALRYELVGYPDVDVLPDSVTGPTLERLEPALPAYRSCWWERHDARNRDWIAGTAPLLIGHEDTLRARLARVYRTEWDGRIPVDAAGYVNFAGANTILNPNHIMIATGSRYGGNAALEIVFHEASHTLMGPRSGAVSEALGAASREATGEPPPRGLWHAVLFYTTGRVVQNLLEERGVTGYEPLVYGAGLFERAWPEFREPLERHWEPYVQDRIGMEEAARRLLAALSADPLP